ncbi:MAG: hypothetical protein ACK561_15670 [Pseudomonadaceae bacterium]
MTLVAYFFDMTLNWVMIVKVVVLVPILLLLGCSSRDVNEIALSQYGPASSARIRVFGNNAHNIWLYPGQQCGETSKSGEINASSSLWGMFKSMANSNDIASIGMPESERTRNLKYGEGYKEFLLPANKPTVVFGRLFAPGVSCNPPSMAFTPAAGKSYEVLIQIDSGMCSVDIGEVQSTGAVTSIDVELCRLTIPSTAPK